MNENVLKYELIRAKSSETLSEKVSARLAKGWQLYGYPSHSDFYNDIWHAQFNIVMSKCEHIYIQAMTKPASKNDVRFIGRNKRSKARRDAEGEINDE